MRKRPTTTGLPAVILARLRTFIELERHLAEQLEATRLAVDWIIEDLEGI